MKARRVARVVDHRAAHSASAVVLAQLDGVLSADHARLGPVKVMRARLIGHPVGVWIPERPSLQHDHPPSASCEALRERRTAGATAHDDHVHWLIVAIAPHALTPWHGAALAIEQEGGVVLVRADGALEREPQPISVSGSQNGPASSTTTLHPRRARRCASVAPPAPQPTTTMSTG